MTELENKSNTKNIYTTDSRLWNKGWKGGGEDARMEREPVENETQKKKTSKILKINVI